MSGNTQTRGHLNGQGIWWCTRKCNSWNTAVGKRESLRVFVCGWGSWPSPYSVEGWILDERQHLSWCWAIARWRPVTAERIQAVPKNSLLCVLSWVQGWSWEPGPEVLYWERGGKLLPTEDRHRASHALGGCKCTLSSIRKGPPALLLLLHGQETKASREVGFAKGYGLMQVQGQTDGPWLKASHPLWSHPQFMILLIFFFLENLETL